MLRPVPGTVRSACLSGSAWDGLQLPVHRDGLSCEVYSVPCEAEAFALSHALEEGSDPPGCVYLCGEGALAALARGGRRREWGPCVYSGGGLEETDGVGHGDGGASAFGVSGHGGRQDRVGDGVALCAGVVQHFCQGGPACAGCGQRVAGLLVGGVEAPGVCRSQFGEAPVPDGGDDPFVDHAFGDGICLGAERLCLLGEPLVRPSLDGQLC